MDYINNYSGVHALSQVDNFKPVFISIKKQTDNILNQYEDKDFLKDPSVDIEAIAYKEDIREIYLVPPERVYYEHSLRKDDIIYLNNENNLEECLFSIAHEIAHRLNGNDISRIFRADANPKIEVLEKTLFNLSIIINSYSSRIAQIVSQKIGKPVSDKNASIILKKMANEYFKKNKNVNFEGTETKFSTVMNIMRTSSAFLQEVTKSIPSIIKKIQDEEIADYIAANLLVPTDRFLLWEDKSDEVIAQAFNVTLGCIQKRRKEVENELYFISPPKEHVLYRELEVSRGNVVGIGKLKIPTMSIFDYNIKWLSFLDIQESENSFVSTCINLRIDGYGKTIEEAEKDMFESIIYFLYQNFSKLSPNDAWENIYGLYEADDWSKELWDVYHEAQVQLINKVVLEEQINENETDIINEKPVEIPVELVDAIRKIKKGLFVHKTCFKVIA